MRREVLWRSVRRVLGADEEILDVAYMWRRHRWFVPFGAVAACIGAGAAALAGFDSPGAFLAVVLAALAVGASAATEYRVLVITAGGLVMLRGGRVRQVATGMIARLPASTTVERLGNNLVISEWQVGDDRFSVLRRFESTMAAIAAASAR